MLDKAVYNKTTHTITLTFNTDSKKTPIDLNLSDLVDTYTAGDGLELSTDHVFSVKKSTEADSENFLTVGPNSIKVSGIQDAINKAAAKATTEISSNVEGSLPVDQKKALDGHIIYYIKLPLAEDSNLINDNNGLRLADKIDCGEY